MTPRLAPLPRDGSPAVFLDRDGTLIEDRGNLSDPSQVVFYPRTHDAVRRLAARFALFIVTNQAGVGEGEITLEEAHRVNAHVVRSLAVPFREIYVCPHLRADNCECHKPKPHFPRRAEREHGIDLRRSFVVGDHPGDVELAASVGARGIFVLTGHGARHRPDLKVPCDIVDGIGEAADRILSL